MMGWDGYGDDDGAKGDRIDYYNVWSDYLMDW